MLLLFLLALVKDISMIKKKYIDLLIGAIMLVLTIG